MLCLKPPSKIDSFLIAFRAFILSPTYVTPPSDGALAPQGR